MAPSSADPPNGSNGNGNGSSRSGKLLKRLAGYQGVTLVSHINPDPDSLASMMALAHLVTEKLQLPTRLTQDGYIGRAENRAMVKCLDLELLPLAEIDWSPGEALVMVDSQPNTGRHNLPDHVPVFAVIDHHETSGETEGIPFIDVRAHLGATCTLVTNYLIEQELEIPRRVATALFYGIESELTGYPREATPQDDEALDFLYPRVNKDILAYIRNARLPQSYFETLLQALQNSFTYEKLIISWAGDLPQPELAAEIADSLIRFEEIEWSFCAGVCDDQMILSLRTNNPKGQAGQLLQEVVGRLGNAGGHDRRAGGSIPLESTAASAIDEIKTQLRKRLLRKLHIDECRGQRLVSRRELLQSLQS